VIYDLHWDPEVYKAYGSLPTAVRRELAAALIDIQSDPLGPTQPYGHDDGVFRVLERRDALVVLPIIHSTMKVAPLQITYVG
jgi:hypothetical protein